MKQFEYLLDYLVNDKNDKAPLCGEVDKEKKIITNLDLRKSAGSTHASSIHKQHIRYYENNNKVCVLISFDQRRSYLFIFLIFLPIAISFNIKSFNMLTLLMLCSVYYVVCLIFLFHHFIFFVNLRFRFFFKKHKIKVQIIHWLSTSENLKNNTYETEN